MRAHYLATTILVFLLIDTTGLASSPVSQSEQAKWLRWLLPLPRELRMRVLGGRISLGGHVYLLRVSWAATVRGDHRWSPAVSGRSLRLPCLAARAVSTPAQPEAEA